MTRIARVKKAHAPNTINVNIAPTGGVPMKANLITILHSTSDNSAKNVKQNRVSLCHYHSMTIDVFSAG